MIESDLIKAYFVNTEEREKATRLKLNKLADD